MKKQILILTGMLALANAAFAQTTPALTLNGLAKDIKNITDQSVIVKSTELLPLVDTQDLKNLVNNNFKDLTKAELLNIQTASLALHSAYISASEKLESILAAAPLKQQETDKLIKLLVRLYQGESFANLIKGPPGFDEGPIGRILTLVANSSNLVQNLHSHFEEIKILPYEGIIAQHGGVITTPKIIEGTFIAQSQKAQHFIAYAIGRLVIYKSELMETSKTTPIGPEKKRKRPITRPVGPETRGGAKTTIGTTIVQ